MQTARSILSLLVLIVFVTVVSGVPSWSAPCCEEDVMECCQESGADTSMPPCCTTVVIVHALNVDVALSALPSLPTPFFAPLPHPIHVDVRAELADGVAMATRTNDRSGPLIPPPLTLIESFLI
ncbi:MAG: hypothetical protein JSS89_06780 [Bacteroidetes bacterium]|nr:hypothetical protein [Bacteroidota bacterium]